MVLQAALAAAVQEGVPNLDGYRDLLRDLQNGEVASKFCQNYLVNIFSKSCQS